MHYRTNLIDNVLDRKSQYWTNFRPCTISQDWTNPRPKRTGQTKYLEENFFDPDIPNIRTNQRSGHARPENH